jgi:hypothetical protein
MSQKRIIKRPIPKQKPHQQQQVALRIDSINAYNSVDRKNLIDEYFKPKPVFFFALADKLSVTLIKGIVTDENWGRNVKVFDITANKPPQEVVTIPAIYDPRVGQYYQGISCFNWILTQCNKMVEVGYIDVHAVDKVYEHLERARKVAEQLQSQNPDQEALNRKNLRKIHRNESASMALIARPSSTKLVKLNNLMETTANTIEEYKQSRRVRNRELFEQQLHSNQETVFPRLSDGPRRRDYGTEQRSRGGPATRTPVPLDLESIERKFEEEKQRELERARKEGMTPLGKYQPHERQTMQMGRRVDDFNKK